jgi:hypothetical protein
MLKNSTYNLMETATVISKGLHRYDQFIKDAGDCQQCRETQLQKLVPHMKQHLEQDQGKQSKAA